MSKKFRMLGITSGIGSMMAPAAFDGDLKERIEIVGNQEWRPYYDTGVFETNFRAPYWSEWSQVPSSAKTNIDMVMGHPECGNYSILNRDKTKQFKENDITDFIEKVSEVQPKFFLMDDLYKSLQAYPASFYAEALPDYDIFLEPISNYHYGNIQKNRKRFFIVGARKELNYTWVPGESPDHMKTVWDKIGDLPTDRDIPEIQHTHYDTEALCGSFKLPDRSRNLTYRELSERFLEVETGKCLTYENLKGETKIRIGHSRLHKDRYSHVIYGGGAQGEHGAYHPETGLPLTVRERGRIQGFPDDFSFEITKNCDTPKKEQLLNIKMTGKAMPLEFCRYATRSFLAHLDPSYDLEPTGERHYGNIPDMITQEKMSYCSSVGYSDQKSACSNCWNKTKCPLRARTLMPFVK